jgi:hypothetical protein
MSTINATIPPADLDVPDRTALSSLTMTRALATGVLLATGILLGGCRDQSAPMPIPAKVERAAAADFLATAGSVLTPEPTFVVLDANGRALGGVAVTITVVEGGGSLLNPPSRTLAGPTSIGQWRLGTRAGRNAVTIAVAGVAPVAITATAVPGPPAELRIVDGNNQSALAGAELPRRVVAAVLDRFGNGVPNVTVAFQPLLGGSAFVPAAVTSDADGRTPPATWTLGGRGRTQTARASADALLADLAATVESNFTIDVRFLTEPTPAIRQIFVEAADRLRALVVGDVPDLTLADFNTGNCGLDFGVLNETVDDLILLADVSNIDGPGRILGRAGPCAIRATSGFPVVGTMQFDASDIQGLIASGRFEAVVLHEMLHVVGVGTVWGVRGLLEGRGTSDPRFIGARGTAGCLRAGFAVACGSGGVPVENTGGSGTRDAHWRESVFDAELMTGFTESTPDMPFSAMTLGSLDDFGYGVNYLAVDPFTMTAALGRAARPATAGGAPWEVVLEPRLEVSPTGAWRPRPLK